MRLLRFNWNTMFAAADQVAIFFVTFTCRAGHHEWAGSWRMQAALFN